MLDPSSRTTELDEHIRARGVALVLAITGILTFAISWRFWTPYRSYPMVPCVPGMRAMHFSVVVLVTACAGLILACVRRSAVFGLCTFVACTCFLILEDQSRLQPYIYVELVLAIGLIYHELERVGLNGLRIALVLVYFWSGIHKLNVHYFGEIFPWLFLNPRVIHSFAFFLRSHFRIVILLAAVSALVEAGAGLLLVLRRTRKLGILVVAVIHAALLVLIGPLGLNYAPVVWPWNLAMIGYVAILFYRHDGDILPVRDPAHALTVFLFGLLPVLNLFSLWDAYLSFHAFSGATMDAYLYVPPGKEEEAPRVARSILYEHKINFADWSLRDNRASAYPAERVYRAVFRDTCEKSPDLELVILAKPGWPSGRHTETRVTCH